MSQQLKVAIIGGSIWGNRGAAAMLETSIARIQAQNENTHFVVFTPYPVKDKYLANNNLLEFFDSRPKALILDFLQAVWHILSGRKSKLKGSLKSLSDSAVLLDIGGITFSDGRLIFLPYNILTIWPAMMLNVPVIKMSQAAGPFKNPIIRFFAKKFLHFCKQTFARGDKTYQYLSELGIPKDKIAEASDVAFLYEPDYCLTSENNFAIHQVLARLEDYKTAGMKIVAISPSILVQEKSGINKTNYDQVLLNLITKTSSQDIHFVIFPNASREKSKKPRNNDIVAIERLRAEAELTLPRPLQKRITWITYDVDTRGIDELVKIADVLVTSRFHAMIFGLRLGIPTLVIGWGHKYMEAMKAFQQTDYVFDYRDTERDLGQVLTEMIERKLEIQTSMRMSLIIVKRSSESQFQYLKEFLNEIQKTG